MPANTEATSTPELVVQWDNVDDPDLATNMPPDVQAWWPYVKQFDSGQHVIFLDWDREMPPGTDPYITIKEPGWGDVLYDNHPA